MPGVTLHYWGGVKSRSFYGNVFLAATNHLNDIELATDYPYPGTPEFAALQNLEQKSAWGQLPFLVDKDTNVKMGESMAIIRYLSKKFGEDPADLVDYALYQQSIDWVGGVHNTLSGANYAPDKAAAFKALFEGKIPKSLAGLEATFVGDGPWIGSSPTAGDYAVAAMLDIIEGLEPGLVAKYSKLAALYSKVFAMDAVQEYVKTVPYAYFKRE